MSKKKKKVKKTDIYQILKQYADAFGEHELEGLTFWSPMYGDCILSLGKDSLSEGKIMLTKMFDFQTTVNIELDRYGYYCPDGDCLVFPSKGQRSWGVFMAKAIDKAVHNITLDGNHNITLEGNDGKEDKKHSSEAKNEYPYAGRIVQNRLTDELGLVLDGSTASSIRCDNYGHGDCETEVCVITEKSAGIKYWVDPKPVSSVHYSGQNFIEHIRTRCKYDDIIACIVRMYYPQFLWDIFQPEMFSPFEKVLIAANHKGKAIWLPAFYAFYDPEKNKHVIMASNYRHDNISNSEFRAYMELDKQIPIIKYNEKTKVLLFKDVTELIDKADEMQD